MEAPTSIFESACDEAEDRQEAAFRRFRSDARVAIDREIAVWRTFQIVALIGLDIAVLLMLRAVGW